MKVTRQWTKQMSRAAVGVFAGVWVVLSCGCGGDGGAPITFEATFGGIARDLAVSVQQTTDGGYIVAGGTDSFGAGGYDMYLAKIDSAGNEVWYNTFGGTEADAAYSVQQTADGGYILAGGTQSYGAGTDMYLLKTDSDGNFEWNTWYGGASGMEEASSVQQTADGGYILAGYTSSFGAGALDMWLVKTRSNGMGEWNNEFGGASSDMSSSVQQTADGGYILAGYSYSFGTSSYMYLVKTDSNGDKVWERLFGGTGHDEANSVQQTADGGYILAGGTTSAGAGGLDVYLVKTDSNGDLEWHNTFGGTGSDEANSVQQTADGGYILAGETDSFGAGGDDMYLVKVDADGNEVWYNTFGGTGDDVAYSVQQTADGGYILAGETDSFGAGDDDIYLVKTDSLGNVY